MILYFGTVDQKKADCFLCMYMYIFFSRNWTCHVMTGCCHLCTTKKIIQKKLRTDYFFLNFCWSESCNFTIMLIFQTNCIDNCVLNRVTLVYKIKSCRRGFGILLPKLFWPTVRKNCSSTRTIYSNSERSEQFLVTECFFNLFLEVSQTW